ncbi:MAG: hypothetical protein JSV98_11170, partial [candidate division WOR-3 bacterium]
DFSLSDEIESGNYLLRLGISDPRTGELLPIIGTDEEARGYLQNIQEVSLLYSRRRVLRDFLAGRYGDYAFVFKVLISLL